MKHRHLHLWLVGASAILLLPGLLWMATSEARLKHDDANAALQPLFRIPLNRISEGRLSERLTIPDSRQWTRMRKVWGEPEFVISAVDQTGRTLICPFIPVQVNLTDPSGSIIRFRRGGPPHGYSASCSESSLRFQATPGDTMTLGITTDRERALPGGYLIVVPDWWNTKDKLVGLALDDEIEFLVRWTSLVGILFLVAGVILTIRRRARKHRTA